VSTVYEYSVLRVIPSIERGESINVGVTVYCRALDFLGCRTHLDEPRLLAFAPTLGAVEALCCGGERAGQAGSESPGRRFRWLTAPRSTIVQPGPVHPGLTDDPAAELDRLLDLLVH
jgi:hypothetical protein